MSDACVLRIGRVRVIPGFARGAYVRKALRVKLRPLTVGPKALRGWSLQLHLKSGIRYLDLVVLKREVQRAGVEPTKPW